MYKCFHFKNLTLFVLLFSMGVFANNTDQWLIQEIKVEDGLPDSTVFLIQQDQSGFMWFGTTNGLARYDGYSFKVFKHDGADEKTISNNNAGNILIDSNNLMWIGTFGGGVNTLNLNTGELIRYPYSSSKLDDMVSENVQTFYEGKDSNMWIGTATGLYKIKGDELTHYNHVADDPNSLIHSRVWSIEGDQNGDLWIGTSEGLSHLNPKTGKIKNYQLPDELIIDISSNQFRKLFMIDNSLWIGSSSGLYSFNIQSKVFSNHSTTHNIKINDIHFINKGQILIASMEGLFQFDLTKNLFRMNDNGGYWRAFEHVDIRDIFFDRSGLLWLATRDSGVIKVDQNGGLFHNHHNFISENQKSEQNKQIWSLEYDSDNNLYVGTSETLFKKSEEGGFERVTTKDHNEVPGIIRDIKVSQNKGTWIGSSEGLYFLEQDLLIAETITEPFNLVGLKPTDIFSVEETSTGEIWLALYNIGILRWQPDTSEAQLIQNYTGGSLTDINIVHIYQDSSDDIWIGSNLIGALRFNSNTEELELFSHDYNDDSSLSSNRIKDIFQDSKGRIWLATFRGLNLFNQENSTFKQYKESDGMIDNSINAILEDSNQNLWIVYKFGLSRFNPENSVINNYLLNTGIRHDGLIPRSAVIDKDNKLYFGSANGYYSFNPKDINKAVVFQPKLALTEVRINNQPISFTELVKNDLKFDLQPNDRIISFNFSSLDFKISEQIQYKYRIQGLHEDWLDVTSSRQIDLNNLNPGHYTIEIKATNNDGRWIEQHLNLNLTVHPVWWNIGWVRILFVLLGVLFALFFHFYRTYKIRKQNELLEATVESRTTELVQLNKQLKQASQTDFLTGLYNRSGFIKHFKKKEKESLNYCIVISDIDNFKIINDVHGHTAGDKTLKKVTKIMRSLLPKGDLIARWGGEEFIFYLGNKDADKAYQIIEHMRLKIQKSKIMYKDKHIPLTCTFGICHRAEGMSLKDCINAADESMYQGKNKGRNNTIVSKES